MCVLLRNYEALDFLESQAGRVAFKLPEPDITLERELVAVSHLIREVGEALESVGGNPRRRCCRGKRVADDNSKA